MNLHQSSSSKIESLSSLWITLGTPLRRADQWRIVCDPKRGQFRGLPHMCGLQIATDGCVLILQREDGRLFSGHITNFEPYPSDEPTVSTSRKTAKKDKNLDAHVNRVNALNLLLE